MKQDILDALMAARRAGRPVALATNLRSGQQRLIFADETIGELCLDVDMLAAAAQALKTDRNMSFSTPAGEVFVHVYNPPPRMFVIGAVHIAQPLAKVAQLTGYGVTVIDPRRSFAGGDRFAGLDVTSEWPDEALHRLRPDARSAIVTLTHDPKIDDPALETALRSPAFYVGALGSKKTHAARLERLRRAGFSDSDLARIHGPVGIAIGAVSPAEIAVSIMAQITQQRRQGGEA
ncbi:MAG TPA: XdhC family protein [Alphaproteobacteria bacterium]|nr:XdhC family protein [Alphaproteobacteria bacterium]